MATMFDDLLAGEGAGGRNGLAAKVRAEPLARGATDAQGRPIGKRKRNSRANLQDLIPQTQVAQVPANTIPPSDTLGLGATGGTPQRDARSAQAARDLGRQPGVPEVGVSTDTARADPFLTNVGQSLRSGLDTFQARAREQGTPTPGFSSDVERAGRNIERPVTAENIEQLRGELPPAQAAPAPAPAPAAQAPNANAFSFTRPDGGPLRSIERIGVPEDLPPDRQEELRAENARRDAVRNERLGVLGIDPATAPRASGGGGEPGGTVSSVGSQFFTTPSSFGPGGGGLNVRGLPRVQVPGEGARRTEIRNQFGAEAARRSFGFGGQERSPDAALDFNRRNLARRGLDISGDPFTPEQARQQSRNRILETINDQRTGGRARSALLAQLSELDAQETEGLAETARTTQTNRARFEAGERANQARFAIGERANASRERAAGIRAGQRPGGALTQRQFEASTTARNKELDRAIKGFGDPKTGGSASLSPVLSRIESTLGDPQFAAQNQAAFEDLEFAAIKRFRKLGLKDNFGNPFGGPELKSLKDLEVLPNGDIRNTNTGVFTNDFRIEAQPGFGRSVEAGAQGLAKVITRLQAISRSLNANADQTVPANPP